MIFESKKQIYDVKNARYVAEWSVDTKTQTVTHMDSDTLEIKVCSFHEDCVKYHLHHREEYSPELLQKTIDEGNILKYLEDLAEAVRVKIDEQTTMWCEQDKDYIVARETSNILKQSQIENAYKFMARDSIYAEMVYV